MKLYLGACLLYLSLTCAGTAAAATTWPDSCGGEKVKFDVQTEKDQPAPAGPAAGKSEIVFLQAENQMVAPFRNATVRFGMDGGWVGATNGNSYFALTVDPGVHHLCASWQSAFKRLRKNVDLTLFTAEPGKVYYYEAKVTVTSRESVSFGISALNEDEAKYRLKISKLSISKPK